MISPRTVILLRSEYVMLEAGLSYFLFFVLLIVYARSLHNILDDDVTEVLSTYFPSSCLRRFEAYCKLTDVAASCSART